jgi:hypothetical protein
MAPAKRALLFYVSHGRYVPFFCVIQHVLCHVPVTCHLHYSYAHRACAARFVTRRFFATYLTSMHMSSVTYLAVCRRATRHVSATIPPPRATHACQYCDTCYFLLFVYYVAIYLSLCLSCMWQFYWLICALYMTTMLLLFCHVYGTYVMLLALFSHAACGGAMAEVFFYSRMVPWSEPRERETDRLDGTMIEWKGSRTEMERTRKNAQWAENGALSPLRTGTHRRVERRA